MSTYSNNSTLKSVSLSIGNTLSEPELAVVVVNACKSYGKGNLILNNLNMIVERGTIYGLLGASGCGKTTILSCIVGITKLDQGNIKVFGHPPGSKESGIPGRTVGYMPQDIALYKIFTIKEMMQYFGRIYGMTEIKILARMEFLINFLDLPEHDRRIDSLSGGQMRRVSLALSLIHQPELLILDEPTVGVDPLLRESIWNHLSEMVAKKRTTIIITTHYLEEAKNFSNVGWMRNGRLIIEAPPQQLLNDHDSDLLEDTFLKLCKTDNPNNDSLTLGLAIPSDSQCCLVCCKNQSNILNFQSNICECVNVEGISYVRKQSSSESEIEKAQLESSKRQKSTNFNHEMFSHFNKIRSVTVRNYLALIRTPWFLIIMLFLPTNQIILGNFIIGRTPKDTAVGVVNNEVDAIDLLNVCTKNSKGCLTDNVSCKFLKMFSPKEINWIPYSSEIEAISNVYNGKTWGYISIPSNYTRHLKDRSLLKNFVDNQTIDGTEILSRLDESFSLKSNFLKSTILIKFQNFLKDVVSDCGGEPRSVEIPLKFNEIYGSSTGGQRGFFLPAQLILIMFLLPMASSLMHIKDKKAGTLDRSMVAGVQNFHYIIAFLISEGCLIFVQLSICLGALVFGFNFEIVGSPLLFMLILFVQGICGLSMGFFIASFCAHELELVLCVCSLFFPILVSSGATWPIESLGKVGQLICYSLPTTSAIDALRSIVGRGWGFSHPKIFPAFVIMGVWIVGTGILTEIIRRIKNK